MATIQDAIERYIYTVGRVNIKASSVTVEGRKLFSYNTIIAEFTDSALLLNVTKYSTTTSRLQNRVRLSALNDNINIVEIQDIPYNTQKLSN